MSESRVPEIEVNVSSLPSRGKGYPDGTKIKYKTYSFGEVKKSSLSVLSGEQSLDMALNGIITDYPKDQLSLNDAYYIGIMRKLSSFGTGIDASIPYVCRGCKKANKHIFRPSELTFKDLDERIESLPLIVELEGRELEFDILRVGDWKKLRDPELLKSIGGELDTTAFYAILVRNMEFKEAHDFLDNLSDLDDVETMEQLDKILDHSVRPLKAICSQNIKDKNGDNKVCGCENYIKLEGLEALLKPFRRSENNNRNKIRFSSK